MMGFNDVDAFIKHIYDELSIEEKGLLEIVPDKLSKLLNETPLEFIDNPKFKELLQRFIEELDDLNDIDKVPLCHPNYIELKRLFKKRLKNLSFESAESFIKYVYDELSIKDEKDLKNISPFELYDLLDETPPGFINHPKIEELRNIGVVLDLRNHHSPFNMWDDENYRMYPQYNLSIDKTILKRFEKPKDAALNRAFEKWISCAQYDFNKVLFDIYSPCKRKSIDLIKLAKMELRELDRFFDSGISNSMAINIKEEVFNDALSPKEIFEYYLKLIRGQYDFFIAEKAPLKDWPLAARVQALFWIKDHLERVIKASEQDDINLDLPKISIDELDKKNSGFCVINPEKTLPVLHEVLLNYCLINDQSPESFRKAFQEGEGKISWRGNSTLLAEFIWNIKYKKIVTNKNYWAIATSIFTTEGKPIPEGSLKALFNQKIDEDKLIKSIIDKILPLY